HADGLAGRPCVRGEGALDGGRGGHGVRRPLEGDEEPVAGRVHLGAAVGGQRLADDPVVRREGVGVGGPEPLEQLRRALDVAEEEGDGAGGERGHGSPRSAGTINDRARAWASPSEYLTQAPLQLVADRREVVAVGERDEEDAVAGPADRER